MLTISTHVARANTYRALAEANPEIFFTIGTHPHQAAEEPDTRPETLAALARHPRCIAIGESGLDYHYDFSPRDIQERVFRTHIAAARETGLPLVIHARNADEAMIRILEEEHGRGRFDAVLHCFSSGAALAEAGIALGFYVSFSGIITFRKSDELRRIAASVPPDRLLVETDAPYIAPEPHRGRSNEPAYVAHTAQALGRVLGLSLDEIARITTDNFYALFRKAAAADAAQCEPALA
jgi:TatD DNase family protein